MKWLIALLSFIFISSISSAQTSRPIPKDVHLFTIPPNEFWHAQPWANDSTYLFPEFMEAIIELENGYKPTHHLLMNYSTFLEMFVVKENNEILPFNYTNEVRYIWLGEHKFLRTKSLGYLEIIMEGRASVAESTFMNAIIDASTVSNRSGQLSDNRLGLSRTSRFYYQQKKYYIFSDPRHLLRASPAALPKIFPKEKRTIRDFERNQHTDYTKKDDVLKVVLFCNREL